MPVVSETTNITKHFDRNTSCCTGMGVWRVPGFQICGPESHLTRTLDKTQLSMSNKISFQVTKQNLSKQIVSDHVLDTDIFICNILLCTC